MKRVLMVALVCVLLCALPLLAQPTTPPANPQADAQASTEEPISVSYGPQQDGGFGVVVKGSAYYPLRRFIAPVQDGVTPPLKTKRFGGFFTPSAYF